MLINWGSRINRRQLLAGCGLLLLANTVLQAIGVPFFIFGGRGALDVMFAGTLLTMVPVAALISQRAHDIGWSAYFPVALFFLPWRHFRSHFLRFPTFHTAFAAAGARRSLFPSATWRR